MFSSVLSYWYFENDRHAKKMDSFNYLYFLNNWRWKNRITSTSTNVHSLHLIISFSRKENTMEMTPQCKSDHSLQQFMVVVLLFSSLNLTRTIKHLLRVKPKEFITLLETENKKVTFPKTRRSWSTKQMEVFLSNWSTNTKQKHNLKIACTRNLCTTKIQLLQSLLLPIKDTYDISNP